MFLHLMAEWEIELLPAVFLLLSTVSTVQTFKKQQQFEMWKHNQNPMFKSTRTAVSPCFYMENNYLTTVV